MLIYSKVVNGVRKLYGTITGIPASTDNELVYKDPNGSIVAIIEKDVYIDNSSNGVQRIRRKSDNKLLTVYIKKANNELVKIIGDDPITPKEITGIRIKNKPYKLIYNYDEPLDLTGMEVEAVYDDSSKEILQSGYTTNPAHGETFGGRAGELPVVVTYSTTGKTFTATFKVTVWA